MFFFRQEGSVFPKYSIVVLKLDVFCSELEKGTDKSKPANTYITIHEKTASRLAARVILPVKEFPQVGRLNCRSVKNTIFIILKDRIHN